MRNTIIVLLWFAMFSPAFAQAQPPNIVYIMADDLGYGDVESFGADRCNIDTPHIDGLVANGMKFTDAHAIASVCVPTRIAVMTGRYPWRFQRPRPDGPWGFLNPRLPVSQSTLGTMLKSAGYRTGYVGKWHLGTLMQTTDQENQGPTNVDYTRPLKIGPNHYGFDYSFILPGSLDMYPYAFAEDGRFVGEVTAQKGWSAFNRVGPAAVDFEDTKVLDTFANKAEAFIEHNASAAKAPAAESRPFFLYVALTAPHTPTSPSKGFEGKSRIGIYGDFVMEVDDCVGRIIKTLRQQGLEENTVVVFTSDHGPASYAGPVRKATINQIEKLHALGHHANGPFRGYKFSVYEGGLRVPFVVQWKGQVRAGSQCDRLIGLSDMMATFADIAKATVSASDAVDSISFRALLTDPQASGKRTNLIMQSTHAFVVRDDRWKLALCPGSGCAGVWGNTPKWNDAWQAAVRQYGRQPKTTELTSAPFVQLFDMTNDPGEQANLAASNPSQVSRLVRLLDQQIADGRSTPGPRQKNDGRVNYHARVPKPVTAGQR